MQKQDYRVLKKIKGQKIKWKVNINSKFIKGVEEVTKVTEKLHQQQGN